MALVQPHFVVAQVGQDLTDTITIPIDTTDWEALYELKTAIGGTTIATKTIGAGIANSPGATSSTMVTTIDTADIADLQPGHYVHRLSRVNGGGIYPIFDWSGFLLAADEAYPQLTNLATYLAATAGSETVGDADAKQLLIMLAAAEQEVRDYCGRMFNYASFTTYPDTSWKPGVLLPECPVSPDEIDVRFDRERLFGDGTQLVYGSDCLLDDLDQNGWSKTGRLLRLGGVWDGGYQRSHGMLTSRPVDGKGMLKVTYSGGFVLIPMDLQNLVFQLTQMALSSQPRGVPFQSESGMNYSYSLSDPTAWLQLPMSVRTTLNKYKRGDSWVP